MNQRGGIVLVKVLKLNRVLLGCLATLALSIFSHSIQNCCFLATYEPDMPDELKEIVK